MEFTSVRFWAAPESMGFRAIWAVDEKGRILHTEPVCSVPVPWHEWFADWLEGIEDCPHIMPALQDEDIEE